MPRIMIISFGYPPDISGGSFNIEAIANELSRKNDVLVVVTNWNNTERAVKKITDRQLRVIQLNHSRGHVFIYKILRKSSLISKSDRLHWVSELYLAYVYNQTLQIAKKYKPDRIVTVCYPFANHIVGREIKKRVGNKWIAYYLDPFFCNDNDVFYRKKWAADKEKSIITEADRVVILRWMKEKYSEYDILPSNKLWCIDLPVKRISNVIKEHNEKQLVFVYIGTIYKGLRSPYSMFEFIQKLSEHLPYKINLILIGKVSGYSSGDVNEWAKKYKDFFRYEGIVEHNQLMNYYNKADVLISIGNTNKTQMPSKVFEYMGVGKPIIHLSKIDGCPVQKVLEKYPLALCINESELNSIDFNEIGNRITELVKNPILTSKDYESLLKQYTITEISKAFI